MSRARILPGQLRHRVRIERPVADSAVDGAGSGTWEPFLSAWAEIEDMLPSRGEKLADGLTIATRPARVRMWWRAGITPDMRIVCGDRIMQIVAPPAELGRRQALEMMVEDYQPAGNPA